MRKQLNTKWGLEKYRSRESLRAEANPKSASILDNHDVPDEKNADRTGGFDSAKDRTNGAVKRAAKRPGHRSPEQPSSKKLKGSTVPVQEQCKINTQGPTGDDRESAERSALHAETSDTLLSLPLVHHEHAQD